MSERRKSGEIVGNLIDLLTYPAIITLLVATVKEPEVKCLTSLLYVMTPLAPFGVRTIREKVKQIYKSRQR